MKSKRRHELKRNVLNVELTKGVEFFKKRGSLILWGGLIVALVVFVIFYARRQGRIRVEDVQRRYDRLITDRSIAPDERLESLKSLTGQGDNEAVAALACVDVADEYARRRLVAETRGDAKTLGETAEQYYRKAIDGFTGQPLAAAKAHMGLAFLSESLGDFSTAKAEFLAAQATEGLGGHPVILQAEQELDRMAELRLPVAMATTTSVAVETQPTTASQPASATTTGATTAEAGEPPSSRPAAP